MKELSRRGFLSGAALGAASLAGAGLFGCSSKPQSGSSNGTSSSGITWGAETEVVVCGAGGTGLAAACAAAKAGAKVICYEIQAGPGGTSALSGGVMQAAGTKWQKEYTTFKTDTPAVHAACYIKQAEGIANEELVKLICDAAPGGLEWLESIGIKWDHVYGNTHVPYCDPENLHADRIHAYVGGGAGGGGKIYTDLEYAEAQKLGVTFEFNCEVKSLIYDKAKGVLGVVVKKAGADINVKASKGVILGLGGIDRNESLAKALNQQQYWDLTTQLCFISDTANGDGIRMGMEIGAALATVGGTIDFDAATGNATNNSLPQAPCVIVNAYGQRFVCEDATYAYQYRAIFQQVTQLQGPAWMILDQNMVEQKYGSWSADIPGAIASGALVTADTYEALAKAIGVPAASFVRTMDTWNMNIATYGADIDYQRDAQLIQLNKPPYYAAKIVAANLGSLGGLEIDAKAQVIDLDGEVIPHLYAGGMNSGGWYGLYYPGSGTSLMGGLVLGRIAGASAAAATAWS